MNLTDTTSARLIAVLLIGVATWWVIAPRSYVACIRKVWFLWASAYPLNAKSWFPLYLRIVGILLWALMLVGVVLRFHWQTSR